MCTKGGLIFLSSHNSAVHLGTPDKNTVADMDLVTVLANTPEDFILLCKITIDVENIRMRA
jgi:hypothetical protein